MPRSKAYPIIAGQFISVPECKTFAGTYYSVGNMVTGIGTDFFRDLMTNGKPTGQLLYPWLLDLATNGQVITIEQVLSPTSLRLKRAFTTDIAIVFPIAFNATGPCKGTAHRIMGEFLVGCGIGLLDQDMLFPDGPYHEYLKNPSGIPPMVIYNVGGDTGITVDYL